MNISDVRFRGVDVVHVTAIDSTSGPGLMRKQEFSEKEDAWPRLKKLAVFGRFFCGNIMGY